MNRDVETRAWRASHRIRLACVPEGHLQLKKLLLFWLHGELIYCHADQAGGCGKRGDEVD
jgi:hypothetical protein